MSANTYLIDAYTRHQIFVERFAGGIWRRVQPIMAELDNRLSASLAEAQAMADASGGSPAWAGTLQADVRLAMQAMADDAKVLLTDELIGFAQYEAGFNERLVSQVVTAQLAGVSADVAAKIGENPIMQLVGNKSTKTTSLDAMIRQLAAGQSDAVRREIQIGTLSGETSQSIINRLAGTVQARTRAQVEAVVRTATAATSAQVQDAFSRANSDILRGERWCATLDRRTTIGCAALDGRIFPIGVGPTIPRHFRCRSRRVPQILPEFALPGFEGQRASEFGPEPGGRTYGGWLRDQPADFQEEVLGAERARLFRSGKLKLDSFADDSGGVYTLQELSQRESITLKRSN